MTSYPLSSLETQPAFPAAHDFPAAQESAWGRVCKTTAMVVASTALLAACGKEDGPAYPANVVGGITAAEIGNDGVAEQGVDNWEVPIHPIKDGKDFIRALRGPVGSEAEGHTIHHGDAGNTLAYTHPTLGKIYITLFGDTSIQKASGPKDSTITVDKDHSFSFVHNDILVMSQDTGRVVSGVKTDAKGGALKSAFIEVPEDEKVVGYDTYFWPASMAVNPKNGDVYVSLTKQVTKAEQDPSNPVFGFEATGDSSLVLLKPTDDPANPFAVASYHKLPQLDIAGYWHQMGAMLQFDDKGNLIVFDSLRKKNDNWAWGYAMGATSVPADQIDNSSSYKRWDGQAWRAYKTWQQDPMMGAGAIVPASVGMEGAGQITRDQKTRDYIVSFKKFAFLSDEVNTLRSKNLLNDWRLDAKPIEVKKYESKGAKGLTSDEQAVLHKLDQKTVTYLGSSFQMHNGKWVKLMSFNYNGVCAGTNAKDKDGKNQFSQPKLQTVMANTGVALAGEVPDLGLEKCLPEANESWPANIAP